MNKREYGIDLIKVWAIISVVALHQLVPIGYYTSTFNTNFLMYVLPMLQILFLSCVPLFITTSAYLLARRKIDYNHFSKITFFILEVVLIYLFGNLLYNLILTDQT